MRRYIPNIIFYFPKRAIDKKAVVMFEESLGEFRLKHLAESLVHNRQKVGFRFGGCPNADRLIRSTQFQEFAALIVDNNCTFCYFGMPTDVGFMALVRAWWLHRNTGTNLLNTDQYALFTGAAKKHLMSGAKHTLTTMLPDLPEWDISHAMEDVRFQLDYGFKLFPQKLNRYYRPL